jgi:HEAT repeat protein
MKTHVLLALLVAVPAYALEWPAPQGDEDQPGEIIRRRTYQTIEREVIPVKDKITHDAIRAIATENDRVERSRALRALGEIANAQDRGLVEKLTGDPVAEVRCEALRALARISEDALVKAAGKAIAGDASSLVRREAAVLLGARGKGDAHLVKGLEDRDPFVREAAAVSLGAVGGAKAGKHLPPLMKDPVSRVKAACAGALAAAKVAKAAGILAKALTDEDETVRGAAALALGSFGADGAAHLSKALGRKDTRHVIQSALLGVARLKDVKKAMPGATKLLSHDDMGIRTAACRACGNLRDASSAPALGKTLADREDQVRRAATLALIDIGGKAAGGVFASCITHKMTAVRREAAWGLGTIKYRDGTPALGKGLKDKDETVRVICAWALGRLGDKECGPLLCGAASDKSPAVRTEIAKALSRADTPAGRNVLVRMLTDESDSVRARAARSIGELKHPAVPQLITALNDYEAAANVRENAAFALGELKAKEAVPHMLKLLTEAVIPQEMGPPTLDSSSVRMQIMKSLLNIGYDGLPQIFLEDDRLSNGEFMGGMHMCRFVAEMLTKATGTKYECVKPKPTYRTWFVQSITPFVMPKPSGPKPLVFPAVK